MVILGSAHNEFSFLSVYGTLGLEVTKTPWTAKIMCSSLIKDVFSKGSFPFQKIDALSAYVLSG